MIAVHRSRRLPWTRRAATTSWPDRRGQTDHSQRAVRTV